MTSILPLTAMFPSQPSPLRVEAAAPPTTTSTTAAGTTATTATTPTAADTAEATRVANIQNQNNGVMGLVHTSLTGLNNFLKNLPSRKTLLGE